MSNRRGVDEGEEEWDVDRLSGTTPFFLAERRGQEEAKVFFCHYSPSFLPFGGD